MGHLAAGSGGRGKVRARALRREGVRRGAAPQARDTALFLACRSGLPLGWQAAPVAAAPGQARPAEAGPRPIGAASDSAVPRSKGGTRSPRARLEMVISEGGARLRRGLCFGPAPLRLSFSSAVHRVCRSVWVLFGATPARIESGKLCGSCSGPRQLVAFDWGKEFRIKKNGGMESRVK